MSYRKKHYPPKEKKSADQQNLFLPEYDNPGVLKVLSTGILCSGSAYQRTVQEYNVDKLIREWDITLMDPLIVSFRDGKYYIVDGQNRVCALRKMNGGKDVNVICRVFSGLTYEKEAEFCYRLDKAKHRLSLAQSTTALIESGADPVTRDIYRLLKESGFTWALDKRTPCDHKIVATRALINAYNLLGAYGFSRLFLLLDGTWHGDPDSLSAAMISGMALFLKTYDVELDDHVFAQRLSVVNPAGIVSRAKADFSTSNNALRVGRVLLEKYNNGRRGGKKLPYRFEG